MTITLLKPDYKLATGPNGTVHLAVKRKPHLCYSLEAAALIGLIRISA
jgi:hypothetical protein